MAQRRAVNTSLIVTFSGFCVFEMYVHLVVS